jgi:hypothetical protein
MKYQIFSFQIIFANGAKKAENLSEPVVTNNIENFRGMLKDQHPDAVRVNLTYDENISM